MWFEQHRQQQQQQQTKKIESINLNNKLLNNRKKQTTKKNFEIDDVQHTHKLRERERERIYWLQKLTDFF